MKNPAQTATSARSPVKVTIRSLEKSKAERIASVVMLLVGFASALVVGYQVLPAVLYESFEQPLQFNHAVHVGDKGGMGCEDCHAFREDGTFAGIPPTASCGDCHSEPIGKSATEKLLIEEYLKPGVEIPWLIYSRQPDNAFFAHSPHVKKAEIGCPHCHGNHGESAELRPYQENRLSGYSRDIWGHDIAGFGDKSWSRMKMDDCVACHEEQGVRDSCNMCHK